MYDKLAPFIAAFTASWFTYIFTIRSQRRALAYHRRLEAVEKIYTKLTDLDHYVEDRCNEINGFKRGWFLNGSPEARKPFRTHLSEFKQLVDSNDAFLPRNEYNFQTILNLASALVEDDFQTPIVDDEGRKRNINSYWQISSLVLESRQKLVACIRSVRQ